MVRSSSSCENFLSVVYLFVVGSKIGLQTSFRHLSMATKSEVSGRTA